MENYSPLRYPGGKSALYPAIANIIESNNMKHCIYIEPFAGGANIAWSLLINGIVDYPPYYEKGQRLYMNYFSGEDHERLRDAVSSLDCKWVMTYDDNIEIDKLYEHYQRFHFSVNYSLANKKKGGELMIFKDSSCIPSAKIIKNLPKTISFDSDSISLEENKMSVCRFCSIANKGDFLQKPENKIIAETNDYFAISSVGALVEGWTLIVPKNKEFPNLRTGADIQTLMNL